MGSNTAISFSVARAAAARVIASASALRGRLSVEPAPDGRKCDLFGGCEAAGATATGHGLPWMIHSLVLPG
jgi:hypothetical protein